MEDGCQGKEKRDYGSYEILLAAKNGTQAGRKKGVFRQLGELPYRRNIVKNQETLSSFVFFSTNQSKERDVNLRFLGRIVAPRQDNHAVGENVQIQRTAVGPQVLLVADRAGRDKNPFHVISEAGKASEQ